MIETRSLGQLKGRSAEQVEALLGRYESDAVTNMYATFTRTGAVEVMYAYGNVGFAPISSYAIHNSAVLEKVERLLNAGYTKVNEVPLSEAPNEDANELFNWLRG